jgi:UTP-glucose-1-phosphate uridylyltransferase
LDGHRYAILSEHKWDSKIRPEQLKNYGTVLDSFDVDEKRLVTIVERPDQKKAAETTEVCVQTAHLLWENIYVLRAIQI